MILRGPAGVPGQRARDSHGGSGEYYVRTLFASESTGPLKYARDLTLKAASSIGIHPHRDDEEYYFIVSGHGLMTVDNEEAVVGPGDMVVTPAGSSHGLRADRGEDVRLLVVCVSARETDRGSEERSR